MLDNRRQNQTGFYARIKPFFPKKREFPRFGEAEMDGSQRKHFKNGTSRIALTDASLLEFNTV